VPERREGGRRRGALVVESPANPRVRSLVALRRRRDRERAGVVVVEGYEELATALASGARPRSLYYCPALVGDRARLGLLDRVEGTGAELVELSRPAFERASYREGPDGWLALVPMVPTGLDRLDLPADPLVLVCESVEKPGNLGAMLRTADAAGVAAVVAAAAVTDWGNPNVVRASKGALFAVPVADAPTGEVVAWLRARGVAIVAATPDAGVPFVAPDLTGGVAVVVGAERRGLSPAWLDQADARVRIPMFGRVNSLNVATAAALVVYEALRQRGRLG
jgi:RNA methyltransferase, TrmH family